MAPHWSGMSIETYVERVQKAVADHGGPQMTFVRSFHDDPGFISFLATRVAEAIATLPEAERDSAMAIFSAHSLPVRVLEDGTQRCAYCNACKSGCRYAGGLKETADLVGAELGLANVMIAWQSAGRTADPWWGPPVEDVLPDLASRGFPAAVVCSAGFVSDHLETLYDLDIEAAGIARDAGIRFARTRMPNDDPAFLDVLAGVVHTHIEKEPFQ
jgi:ferrochelatase